MHFAAAGFAEASLREWTLDQEASFRKPIQASTNRADHCCFRRYGIRLLAAAANLHDRTRCDCNRIQGTCLWIQIEYCAVVICGIIIVYLVCSPKKIILPECRRGLWRRNCGWWRGGSSFFVCFSSNEEISEIL